MPLARHLFHHQRLYLSCAAGAASGFLVPASQGLSLRIILGWDGTTVIYLVLVLAMMATSDHQHMRRRAAVEDEGRWVLLALTSGAALASLFAIGVFLSGSRDLPAEVRLMQLVVGAVTILLSWLFIHALYAVHYAYDHYRALHLGTPSAASGGLNFPGTPEPDYWDFCYFAYTVGMTAQTSDISVSGSRLRRLTLIHGIVSFCFNTVLLALTVNIAAGLL